MNSLFVAILVCLVVAAHADECTITSNCNDCQNVNSTGVKCLWVQDCIHNASPIDPTSKRQYRCVNFNANPNPYITCSTNHTCSCSSYYNCDLCVRDPECAWASSPTALNPDSVGSCLNYNQSAPVNNSSQYCKAYCHYANNCAACNSMAGLNCAWCPLTGSCVEQYKQGGNAENCIVSTTCEPLCPAAPSSSGGFDAGSFFGGIILAVGLTVIGFFAFRYYKIRSATGRSSYNTVN